MCVASTCAEKMLVKVPIAYMFSVGQLGFTWCFPIPNAKTFGVPGKHSLPGCEVRGFGSRVESETHVGNMQILGIVWILERSSCVSPVVTQEDDSSEEADCLDCDDCVVLKVVLIWIGQAKQLCT